MGWSLLEQHSRVSFAEILHDMGYKLCQADQDVWLQPATTEDGFDYYEYILVYAYDILLIFTIQMNQYNRLCHRLNLKMIIMENQRYSLALNCNGKILMDQNVGQWLQRLWEVH